ncbi:MAG: IS630 family transposase, partial [Deltaproteobacteria bacterium]|nr:IS630 family transposase [Deltaproteobacteria bacterium]
MPFKSERPKLELNSATRQELESLSRSRTEPINEVKNATIIISYANGESISAIARKLGTNRPKIERCVNKALQLGPIAALKDLFRSGRKASITPEARTWLVSLACQKPLDLGYPYELWTTSLLAKHARKHCLQAGHPCLSELSRGTVSKLLSKAQIKPHKIKYYLEKRDPEFDEKMAQVLCVYKQIEILKANDDQSMTAVISYDEKPGIQAISVKAPDLPPVPDKYPCVGRDPEYIRQGTLTLMAGIDLLKGHIHKLIVERHRSREFIDFLKI